MRKPLVGSVKSFFFLYLGLFFSEMAQDQRALGGGHCGPMRLKLGYWTRKQSYVFGPKPNAALKPGSTSQPLLSNMLVVAECPGAAVGFFFCRRRRNRDACCHQGQDGWYPKPSSPGGEVCPVPVSRRPVVTIRVLGRQRPKTSNKGLYGMAWEKKKSVLEWPSQSPALNLIKCIW